MLVLRNLLALVPLLGTGVSALVASNFERGVSGAGLSHRRHAANVLAAREPGSSSGPGSILHRRAQRQKRCEARFHSSSSADAAASSTSSSSSQAAPTNDVPINVGGDPAASSNQAQQPAPTQSTNTGGDTFTGELTYYDVGLGACGIYNDNSQMVAAVSQLLYDGFDGYTGANPNNNPVCGKTAVITYQGKSISVTVIDRCVGCAKYDVDLSPTAFQQLSDLGAGRLHGATWHFQ